MSDEQKMIDDIEQLCADVCATIRISAPQEDEYVVILGVFAAKMLNAAAAAYAEQQGSDEVTFEHSGFIKALARLQALGKQTTSEDDEIEEFLRVQEEIIRKGE